MSHIKYTEYHLWGIVDECASPENSLGEKVAVENEDEFEYGVTLAEESVDDLKDTDVAADDNGGMGDE